MDFGNRSNCDIVIKDLAKEFEGEFNCQWENTENTKRSEFQ